MEFYYTGRLLWATVALVPCASRGFDFRVAGSTRSSLSSAPRAFASGCAGSRSCSRFIRQVSPPKNTDRRFLNPHLGNG